MEHLLKLIANRGDLQYMRSWNFNDWTSAEINDLVLLIET